MKTEAPMDLAGPFANYTQGMFYWGLAASTSQLQGLTILASEHSSSGNSSQTRTDVYGAQANRLFNTLKNETPSHTRIQIRHGLAYHASTSITTGEETSSAQITRDSTDHTALQALTKKFFNLAIKQTQEKENSKSLDKDGNRIAPDGMSKYLETNRDQIFSHEATQKLFKLLADIPNMTKYDGSKTIFVDSSRIPRDSSFTLNGHNFKLTALILGVISSANIPENNAFADKVMNAFISEGFSGAIKAIKTADQAIQKTLAERIVASTRPLETNKTLKKKGNSFVIDGCPDHSFQFIPIDTPPTLDQAISYAEAAQKAICFKERFIDPTERLHLINMCTQYAVSHPDKKDAFDKVKKTLEASLENKTTLGKTPSLTEAVQTRVDSACHNFDELEASLAAPGLDEQLKTNLSNLNYHLTLEKITSINDKLLAKTPKDNTAEQKELRDTLLALKEGLSSLANRIREKGATIDAPDCLAISRFTDKVHQLKKQHSKTTQLLDLFKHCETTLAKLPSGDSRCPLAHTNTKKALTTALQNLKQLTRSNAPIPPNIHDLKKQIEETIKKFETDKSLLANLNRLDANARQVLQKIADIGLVQASSGLREKTLSIQEEIIRQYSECDPITMDVTRTPKQLEAIHNDAQILQEKATILRDIIAQCDTVIKPTEKDILAAEVDLRNAFTHLRSRAHLLLSTATEISDNKINPLSDELNQANEKKTFIIDLLKSHNEHIQIIRDFERCKNPLPAIKKRYEEVSCAAKLIKEALSAGLETALTKKPTKDSRLKANAGAAAAIYKEVEARQFKRNQKRALFIALSSVSVILGGTASALAAVFLPPLLATASIPFAGFAIAACIAIIAIGACVLLAIKAHQKRAGRDLEKIKRTALRECDVTSNMLIRQTIETARKEKADTQGDPNSPINRGDRRESNDSSSSSHQQGAPTSSDSSDSEQAEEKRDGNQTRAGLGTQQAKPPFN